MIIKLIKLLILLLLAGTLLLAVIGFLKKAKTQTKSQTKAQLKKARWLRADALLLAVLVTFVYMLTAFFDLQKRATAVVTLNYAEASLGQNANGTRYNMSEIICDDVLARTIEKGGLENVTVDDLKDCLSVYPLIQGNAYSKDNYHISTEFVVDYVAGKKLQKYSADMLLQLLCNSYRDYYFDTYVNDFAITTDLFDEQLKDLDYIDAATLLSKKANKILNYLYGLQNKNSSFVSSSGATFASVASKAYNLNDTQIGNTLYAFILQNGISKDPQRLLQRLNFTNVQAGFDKQKMQQSYTTTNDTIAAYDKDMTRVVLVPTWDNDGQYYMGRTKVGIDVLSVQSVNYSKSIAEIEKRIQDNNLKLTKFSAAAGNTAANHTETDALIESISASLKKLAEEARSIGQEYYSNQMNQCVSASVSSISIFSKTKTALLLLLCAYAVFWARKTVKEFSAPQEGER